MTSVEKVKAEVKIRTAQQPNPPLPVLLLPLFRTPHPRTVHDLCSQGIESLSVDEVGQLMTELGLGYSVAALRKEQVDGEELKEFKEDNFVKLLENNGFPSTRYTKGKKMWRKINDLLVTNLHPKPCPSNRNPGQLPLLLLSEQSCQI